MTVDDFKKENFTQAQEEAAAHVADALEQLVEELGLKDPDSYLSKAADFLDLLTMGTLVVQEAQS